MDGAAVWIGGLSEVSLCIAASIQYCRASKHESPTPIVHIIRIVKAFNSEAISLSKRPPATQEEQCFILHPTRNSPTLYLETGINIHLEAASISSAAP